MQIKYLRKLYPFIHENQKNIRWRNLTDAELDVALAEKQVVSNCYMESAKSALLSNDLGRKVLKQRIKIENKDSLEPAYKFKFLAGEKEEVYRVGVRDYYGRSMKLYNDYYDGVLNFLNSNIHRVNLGLSTCIAVQKLIAKHPTYKSILSRIYMFPLIRNYKCEFNKPSNAFKWLTGKQPRAIGEDTLSFNLKKHKDEVLDVFNNFDKNKDCYIVMTNHKKFNGIDKWHCLSVTDVDKSAQTVDVLNKRNNKSSTFTFDDVINHCKALVGLRLNS